jgi:hypothetical protein
VVERFARRVVCGRAGRLVPAGGAWAAQVAGAAGVGCSLYLARLGGGWGVDSGGRPVGADCRSRFSTTLSVQHRPDQF